MAQITRALFKKWRGSHCEEYVLKKHKTFGYYILDTSDDFYNGYPYAWQINLRDMNVVWITKRTMDKHFKRGTPPPTRKKPNRRKMKEIGMFSMEEMEEAYKVMEELGGQP